MKAQSEYHILNINLSLRFGCRNKANNCFFGRIILSKPVGLNNETVVVFEADD